jgi:hypothetical protein
MTFKERREAIKDYVRRNRDFAFFFGGATSVVLAEIVLLKHLNTKNSTVEGDNYVVNVESIDDLKV